VDFEFVGECGGMREASGISKDWPEREELREELILKESERETVGAEYLSTVGTGR
jgi:hypothetical protein